MKRVFTYILIACVLLSFTAYGQRGEPGQQDSTSVEQIENMPVWFPGCLRGQKRITANRFFRNSG